MKLPTCVAKLVIQKKGLTKISPCPSSVIKKKPVNYASAVKVKRKVVLRCLDCGLGFYGVSGLEDHLGSAGHLARLEQVGDQVKGLVGEGGMWWCGECEMWVQGREGHSNTTAHMEYARAGELLRGLTSQRVECHVCQVADMGVEEARSHLFTTEHRQFLQDRLEDVEEDWCAFAVCHELKESGFQDIHVIKIPYSMKEKTFKKFVLLLKNRLIKIQDFT